MDSEINEKRSERVKKIRRRVEEKLRKGLSDDKIEALAVLLDVDTRTKEEVPQSQ